MLNKHTKRKPKNVHVFVERRIEAKVLGIFVNEIENKKLFVLFNAVRNRKQIFLTCENSNNCFDQIILKN